MIASAANAAGLGKLVVLSAMGEPFRAEIELLGVSQLPDTRSTLTPRLVPPELYPLLGFRYNPALTGARLNIQSRAYGRHVLEVASLRPLNEPFVYLLVELESDATRIVRGYTALLDPPGFRAPRGTAGAEFFPAVVSATAAAVTPAVVRAPAVDRSRTVTRPVQRQEQWSDANAKTLATMMERVAALEAAVTQLQRQWGKLAVAAPPPPVPPPVVAKAVPDVVPPPPAPPPVAAKAVPVVVPSPPVAPVVQEKPAAPAEFAPRRPSGQDSLLNNALLVLAIGLLLTLGGLVYVVWGRPAVQERKAKGGD